eukprot:364995-Chlamydomonas_euryale.AAC.2
MVCGSTFASSRRIVKGKRLCRFSILVRQSHHPRQTEPPVPHHCCTAVRCPAASFEMCCTVMHGVGERTTWKKSQCGRMLGCAVDPASLNPAVPAAGACASARASLQT